jgi:hypothetical protein
VRPTPRRAVPLLALLLQQGQRGPHRHLAVPVVSVAHSGRPPASVPPAARAASDRTLGPRDEPHGVLRRSRRAGNVRPDGGSLRLLPQRPRSARRVSPAFGDWHRKPDLLSVPVADVAHRPRGQRHRRPRAARGRPSCIASTCRRQEQENHHWPEDRGGSTRCPRGDLNSRLLMSIQQPHRALTCPLGVRDVARMQPISIQIPPDTWRAVSRSVSRTCVAVE